MKTQVIASVCQNVGHISLVGHEINSVGYNQRIFVNGTENIIARVLFHEIFVLLHTNIICVLRMAFPTAGLGQKKESHHLWLYSLTELQSVPNCGVPIVETLVTCHH